MAFITDILNTIKNARKGKDMRQAIYDGIQQCYKDATGHPDSVAAVVERLKIEKGRIDELATSQTFTGNYTQSNLVFHAYRNATTGDPDPDDSYNYEGTSGKHEMPICKIFQEGTLDFAEKQSNEKVKILKEGLYIFELRIFISGSGKLDIEARINDVSQRYNAWQIVAQSTEETKIIAYILYLKGDDVVSFYGTPGLQASVRAPVSDVNCYVLDWIGKAQISDCSKEISDIRVGADGNTYPTAGEAIREQIGNLTEDLSNKITKFYASNQGKVHIADSDNGKIQDMMLYGKSEQFTTIGKNILKIKDGTQTLRGVTVTAKDGVVTLKGTATESGWAVLTVDSFVLDGTYILSSNISSNIRVLVASKSFKTVLEQGKSATLENAEASKVCFTITEGKTYDISNILIQIEKGSVATSYEPYTGGIPSPNPSYPQEIKSVVNPIVKLSNEDGTKSETVTLPYTLNAIPVSSGGNVTIDGQQYIADYVDVERGKLVRMVAEYEITGNENWTFTAVEPCPKVYLAIKNMSANDKLNVMCDKLKSVLFADVNRLKGYTICSDSNPWIRIYCTSWTSVDEAKNDLKKWKPQVQYVFATPVEIALTTEEIAAFKALVTYYPVTNISVTSDHLDGYTVFNYPISMANGWNYVKQQLNDNRDYIYDMDTQSAEAYVNSEYAVALTELEV